MGVTFWRADTYLRCPLRWTLPGTVLGTLAFGVTLGLALGLVGCGGETPADNPDAGADALVAGADIELAIVGPAPGSMHIRDAVGDYGALVARVDLQVQASGPYARIAFEDDAGEHLGNPGTDLVLPAEFRADGPVTIVALAYGEDGQIAAMDTIDVTIQAPEPADCYEWLDLYGVNYTLGPDRPGVAEPVTVTTPIGGVAYRYVSFDSPRTTFFMHCDLALALAQSAYHLRIRDIIEVVDIGVYNYRCIGGGTPPDCPNGISQHAYARAIDIAGYTTGDGSYFSVNDDWIIDDAGEATCDADTEPGKDFFLHDAICAQKQAGIWNTVLTPNYNAGHRDHFHIDRKPGADFIKSLGIKSLGIDVGPDDY